MAEHKGLFTSDKMQAWLAEEPAMETNAAFRPRLHGH